LSNYTPCEPRARCGQWRTCPHCAAIRQAQAADRAERGHAATGGALTYAVIIPDCAADTAKIRASLTKHLPALGGMWAVQTGEEVRGLHIDLITAAAAPLEAVEIAAACNAPGRVWAQPITAADLRNVTAYATRQAAMPPASEYSGHLVGTFGGWRGIRDVLITAAATPQSPAPLEIRAAIVAAELARDDCEIHPAARATALHHVTGLLDALRHG